MNILDLLKRITGQLEDLGIDYMISGSMAANIYAVSRMTRDIDIIVNLREEDADAFIQTFLAENYLNEQTIREEIKARGFFNLINYETGFKIDLVILKKSDFRQEEFQRKRYCKIDGFDAWVVSPEDLILSKLIWNQELRSELQESDIRLLLENKTLDMKYIRKWITKLMINTHGIL